MRREKNLLAVIASDAYFRDSLAAGAKQFKRGFPPLVQMLRGGFARLPHGHPQLRRCGVVDQEKPAILVLNRDAGRKQPENIP
jgi:hypothetical protein